MVFFVNAEKTIEKKILYTITIEKKMLSANLLH